MSSPLRFCCAPATAPASKRPARKERRARRALWLGVSLTLALASGFSYHETATAGAAPASPGSISFVQSGFSVGEGAGRATITVSRTGGTDGRVSAVVRPTDVTTNNADYIFGPGSVDFLDFSTGSGTNLLAEQVLVQPDGKILICGFFSSYNGVARNNVARLHPDGTLDATFNPAIGVGDVSSMALQPDGKLIVVGVVRSADGTSRKGIERLNSDGSLDAAFTPGTATGNYGISALALLPDGKILIGGNFPEYDGVARQSVARLNPDGTLDTGFVPAEISSVGALLPLPDGNIIVGGNFGQVDGETRLSVARLNADGSHDTSFNRNPDAERIFVRTLALQHDGKVLVGGSIYSNLTFNGIGPTPLLRLNDDGSSDPAFADPGLGRTYHVLAVAQQEDGKLLVGGNSKAHVVAEAFYFIRRLNTGGGLDNSFIPNVTAYANSAVYSMALQADGRILVAGQFSQIPNGGSYAYLNRLNNDLFVTWEDGDAADKSVSLRLYDDNFAEPDETMSLTLTPLRGGAATGTHPSATLTITDNEPVADAQSVTTDEDTPRALTLTGSDVDGTALTFTVTANPLHGTLSGSGANRTYTPFGNYSGPDSFKFRVNSPEGGQSTEATVSITVNAINDAPVNTVPAAQAVSQNGQRVFSIPNFNAVAVADADAGANPVRVTLSAANGTLTLGSTAGLTFVSGDGTADASMTFTGAITSVNSSLSGLVFRPTAGFTGAAGLQITTDDQGNSGAGGALSDTDSVAITVHPGGTLQFGAATYEADEDGLTASVIITRTGGSFGTASVNLATSPGTATGGAFCGAAAGMDYADRSTTLTWADGDTSNRTVAVVICNDTAHESDETVNLTLSGVAGSGNAGAQTTAVLTIHDDDPAGGAIEFTQSTYATAEGAGSRTVTVRRVGDSALAVSVDYSTEDGSVPAVSVPCSSTGGMALDRCDFTKALGTLHFAAGETQKTFQVMVGDDTYVEGTETASLKLSNPGGGAGLGQRDTAALSISDNVPEPSGNAIDDDAKFVRQNYHDFLNREADAAGLTFWTTNITGCGTNQGCREVKRIDTSAAFFLSVEFRETGFLVYRMYKAAYGDLPGKPVPLVLSEFLTDTQRIGRGVVVNAPGWEQALEANTAAFADEFAARARFAGAYPQASTPEQFVDALDANTAGSLSQGERDALVAHLTNGTRTRAQVLRAVAEDADFDARERNRAFVLMQYFGYLRRNPNDAPEQGLNFDGYNFWLQKLNQFGGDFRAAEMVKAFITSAEYRARFGQP